MLEKPESACFVIADISGYTSFLNAAELDHAQDILADLMDTVVRGLRPPFRLAKFEGDAAFVYAVTDKVDGTLLQDAVEAAYFAFRKRLRNIAQATTCVCNACRMMRTLDLKFVSHHGEFVKHKVAGRQELAGKDVIVVHRLLKNAVNERLGGRAYALYSEACISAMGIDPAVQGLLEHHEQIDIFGEVRCWVRDLEEAWIKESGRQRVEVARKDAALVLEYEMAAPRPAVWEHFTHPGHRPKWQGSDEVREMSENGRRGAGTTNHCMHGKATVVEEILDWRPFDYVTLATLVPVPGAPKILLTYLFSEQNGVTRVEVRVGKPKPKESAIFEEIGKGFPAMFDEGMHRLRLLVEHSPRQEPVVEEPLMPVSAERFLTQPIRAH